MSLWKRIFLFWAAIVAVAGSSLFFPHVEIQGIGFLSNALQFLLLILCLYLIKFETVKKTRVIFINFAALFGMAFMFHLYSFVGRAFFLDDPMARHYYFQYVSNALYFFLLAFAICYVTVDVLFRDFKVFQKCLLTFVIVGGFFGYYYHPYFSDARYLYTTQEIEEWRELDRASASFKESHGVMPSVDQLAMSIGSKDASILGRFDIVERKSRVEELYPYLDGLNYKNLLFKPLYLNSIYMCVLAVGLILLFFGYQYKKDPPQGAYIEKMMFFFLMFFTLEIFHAWSFIKTIEWQSSLQIIEIGQFLSAGVLGVIAIFFAMRLHFICSAYGGFYEHEIAESPSSITRWRDSLDNLVIAHFFTRNELIGRLFVGRNTKAKVKSH